MKVAWKDFAQRRKLNLEMFANMMYKDYVQWCDIRSVEPVSKESFEGVKSLLAVSKETKIVVPKPTMSFDEKQLKKMRKSSLQELCDKNAVEYETDQTKSDLVKLLLSLNNDK